ncbi:MAG: UV DNA damage repair endonuclease UvsE [Acidobacteriota bacterium]|nr:UV DNA damage repair endonuclease UvsE [Acidobacteriota bacterium]
MKAETQCVRNNLGLVCITTTDAVRYKTVTRKRLLSFDEPTQKEMLRALYQENVNRVGGAIEFCQAHDINLYRLSSQLFPFSDEPVGAEILGEFADQLSTVGKKAIENNLRIVMHPDQFVVLSSDSETVIENSVKILRMHARTLDMLQQPRSEWATMNIHGGKADRADKLVASVEKLPDEIRSRIAFENDEYSYSSAQILEVCRRAKVPMVFDAHHHVCREKLDDYNDESVTEMFWAARTTWANPENQLVHISNGRDSFQDRAHHDLIFDMPEVFRYAPWIEVEAKHKEIAIEKLNNEWLTGSFSR